MAEAEEAKPVKPPKQAVNKGVATVLSEDDLASLTSFFDLLIQMDLESQSNEERESDDSRRKDVRDDTTSGK